MNEGIVDYISVYMTWRQDFDSRRKSLTLRHHLVIQARSPALSLLHRDPQINVYRHRCRYRRVVVLYTGLGCDGAQPPALGLLTGICGGADHVRPGMKQTTRSQVGRGCGAWFPSARGESRMYIAN